MVNAGNRLKAEAKSFGKGFFFERMFFYFRRLSADEKEKN